MFPLESLVWFGDSGTHGFPRFEISHLVDHPNLTKLTLNGFYIGKRPAVAADQSVVFVCQRLA